MLAWKVIARYLDGQRVVYTSLGLLLLVAAGLKGYQLATAPVLGSGLLDSRWLLIATVEFELFFGLWLLAGLLPRLNWAAAVGCFGLFAAVSLYKAVSGKASCGCFGPIEINPWYTFMLDVTAVFALLRWRPSGMASSTLIPTRAFVFRTTAVMLAWLSIGIPAAVAMSEYQPAVLAENGIILGDDNTVVLELEKWPGKQFPLFSHIDIGNRLRSGMWLVLFVRPKCSACHEAVVAYKKLAQDFKGNSNCPKVAIIECPPYTNTASQNAGQSHLYGYLSSNREWVVETPTTLLLDEGKVQNLFDNSRDLELLNAIWGKQEKLTCL